MEGQIDLGYGEIFIGRSMECAIRTDDPLVSRRHARIYFQNGGHWIEDLQSANGIFLGELRVQTHNLQNGDNVRCGNLWLRYVNEQAPAFPGVSAGPQMSPGGGTQLLNVNDPFIPGRQAEPAAIAAPPVAPLPPLRPQPPPPPVGLPPNPFAPSLGIVGGPPP